MAEELPSGSRRVAEQFPQVWKAYSNLGESCAAAGPLDARAVRLVKLALAIATQSEGATHSQTRRALAEGIEPECLRQVALLGITTMGFPQAVAALTWIEDILD